MTTGNGKPSLDGAARSTWDADGLDRLDVGASGEAAAVLSGASDEAFSAEARMAHELVSLFLTIDDHDARERCLAFVREQAEGRRA